MLARVKQRLRHQRRGILTGTAFAAAAGLLAWLPRLGGPAELTAFEKFGYDFAHLLHAPAPPASLVVIEMDQRSFKELGQETSGLWDRTHHLRLLRKLTADGARVVVFDVLFDKAMEPESDRQLADAMRRHSRVALAAVQAPIVRPGVTGREPVFPVDAFRDAAAGVGLVDLSKDRDGAVRRPFRGSSTIPSLPRLAAQLAGAASLPEEDRTRPRWLRFYGDPASDLGRMSYIDALDQPDGYFSTRYVFIGSALQVKRPGEPADYFRTSYSRWDGSEAPGVSLLATEFLNLIHGDAIRRAAPLVDALLILAGAALAALGCVGTGPWKAAGWAAALAGGVAVLGLLAQGWGQWVCSWVLVAGVVVPCGWGWAAVRALQERGRQPSLAPTVIMPPDAVPPGTAGVARIPDHVLLRAVGKGAYGEVWLARNVIGMYRAVKIIYRRQFDEAGPYEREFHGVTKFMPISLSHPGFVNIHHVGRDDALQCFYCIMEPADDEAGGQNISPESYSPKTLSRHLHVRRRLPPLEVLRLGLPLSAALQHLHDRELIHRDIKPGNIIFVRGAPKLADIGLVTDMPKEARAATYLGTMGYIAPEGPGTPAADIYSLGKVLYEAFTGLDREEFPNLPSSLLAEPEVASFSLNQIILKACEPDPRRRYQTAAQLCTDLEALRTKLGVGA